MSWRESAACRGKEDLFFPARDDWIAGRIKEAKRICHTCPVIVECLDFVLAEPQISDGVWADMTARQVNDLRRELGVEVRPAAPKIYWR